MMLRFDQMEFTLHDSIIVVVVVVLVDDDDDFDWN